MRPADASRMCGNPPADFRLQAGEARGAEALAEPAGHHLEAPAPHRGAEVDLDHPVVEVVEVRVGAGRVHAFSSRTASTSRWTAAR